MDLNQTRDQMEMFGYTAEGAQQEADKFVEEAGDLETDISNAASSLVPFYDSGVNIVNVAQEYMKPEQERDYEYIKDQFREAGQSAAIEGGLLLMGGVAGKYGAKGIKALADKVKQYEIDPTAMSAFGAGAIKKKSDDITKLNQDKVIDEISEVESASNPKPVKISNKQKTVKAYKLFKTNDKGDLYPLFVKMEDNKPIPKGKWIKAEEGSINLKTGKVKSSIGDLAYRPGFHAGDLPIATHIGGKVDLKTGQRLKGSMPPNIREENQVWAEVEMLDEVDWQSVADKRARIKKDGTPDVKTAHITDQIPFGGFYRYKTNPNMTGNWLIGGELKVKKVLSSDEVKKINDKAGVSDLPKLSDLGLKFNKGGAVMNDQMEMAFMQEGGIMDDGMDVDPVSGNEVPPGSLAEEVRDDIPAQLSEGEYVVPADVVRYYGVKFFEDLRDQAKMGLADMEANGRIGGEPVPEGGPVNDQELSEQEMAAIREVMGMAEGGTVQNPYLQQQQMYRQPAPQAVGNTIGYDQGGDTPSYAKNVFNPMQYGLGFSFMGQPQQTGAVPGTTTPGTTTPGDTTVVTPVTGGVPTLTLYGPNGEIRTFNLPLSATDAAEVTRLKELGYSETKAVTPTPTPTGSDRGERTKLETDPNKWMENFDYTDMSNLGSQTSDLLKKAPVGSVMGAFMNATTAAQAAANLIILKNNGGDPEEIAKLQAQYDQFIKDSKLGYMPKGLINGDRLAKDIVENNIDIALNRDSVDLNNKPLFKDDNDFNKFMEKVGPRGMEFDPTEGSYKKKKDRDIGKILGGKKVETTPAGVDVYTPTTSTPRPKARPSALVKTRTDSTGKKAGDVGYESALRKRQADKRKKYQKTQREKMKAFKKREQKTGVDGRNIGGRAEGGLMKKGNK